MSADVLPDDELCACLDETGSRQARLYERCQRCKAFMLSDEQIVSPEALVQVREALEEIRRLADWYATIHAGPELEVHHALKVEVLDLAERALRLLPPVSQGEPE